MARVKTCECQCPWSGLCRHYPAGNTGIVLAQRRPPKEPVLTCEQAIFEEIGRWNNVRLISELPPEVGCESVQQQTPCARGSDASRISRFRSATPPIWLRTVSWISRGWFMDTQPLLIVHPDLNRLYKAFTREHSALTVLN
jgi:hypothetical protein